MTVARPGATRRARRRSVPIATALVAVTLLWGCTSEEAGRAEQPPTEVIQDPTGDGEPPEASGGETSARDGPEGRRTLDVLPDEIPAGLAPAAARDIEAEVSRGDGFWSAAATFVSEEDPEDWARRIDGQILDDGFSLRRRVIETDRIISTYDGPDDITMTVTVRPDGGTTRTTATIVEAS